MNKLFVAVAGASMLGVLAGCGGVSEVTKERVARSETSVQQAQQAIGTSEAGAVELQQAKEKLELAQRELKRDNAVGAERLASQAQLTAELAVAKSQSAQARKAADELFASIETLRQEAGSRLNDALSVPHGSTVMKSYSRIFSGCRPSLQSSQPAARRRNASKLSKLHARSCRRSSRLRGQVWRRQTSPTARKSLNTANRLAEYGRQDERHRVRVDDRDAQCTNREREDSHCPSTRGNRQGHGRAQAY